MYGTTAGFDSYFEDRDVDVSAFTDVAAKSKALLVASEYIDNIYGDRFIGYKTGGYEQQREWPRENAVVTTTLPHYDIPDNVIPLEMEHATYEAALRHLQEKGSLQKDFTPREYNKVSIEDALSVEYSAKNSANDFQLEIPVIPQILFPLFDDRKNSSNLSGGSVRA